MRIVLGLGNPGARYRWTRHNVGFRVVDRLAERWGIKLRRNSELARYAWVARGELNGQSAILAKPTTYMNRVGVAAQELLGHYNASVQEMLVVYDDADLELGRLRIREGGGAGGHNGVRSLIERLRTHDIPRIRLGIRGSGRKSELEDYVLQEFAVDELELVDGMIELAVDAVEVLLRESLSTAMNRFNGISARDGGGS